MVLECGVADVMEVIELIETLHMMEFILPRHLLPPHLACLLGISSDPILVSSQREGASAL